VHEQPLRPALPAEVGHEPSLKIVRLASAALRGTGLVMEAWPSTEATAAAATIAARSIFGAIFGTQYSTSTHEHKQQDEPSK
jgi:hypothetical protein